MPTEALNAELARARQFESGGHLLDALEAYRRAQLFVDAARVAWALGRPLEAARLSIRAGRFHEAGLCFLQGGEAMEAIQAFVQVPPTDARYRETCLRIAEACARLGSINGRITAFLRTWLDSTEIIADELPTLKWLSTALERAGLRDDALLSIKKLMRLRPDDAQLLARMSALMNAPSAGTPDHALQEERAFYARRRPASTPAGDLEAAAANEARTDTLTSPVEQPRSVEDTVLQPGAVVAGRYEIIAKLGTGGTSGVFEALDKELQQKVALKVFNQQLTSEDMQARFRREVALSRQMNHPNIVRVFDIGTVAGRKYMTMELLEGKDLGREIDERPRIDIAQCIHLGMQACGGLQYVHDMGVVHRDIKPGNFFVTPRGLKLMDFGLARDTRGPAHTLAGIVMGTPEFMAPEQFNEFNKVTAVSDVYSLGICFFQLVTGLLPFTHVEIVPLAMMHHNEKPPSPRKLNPEIPPFLEQIICRMIEKKQDQRFQSCNEVRDALATVLAALPPR